MPSASVSTASRLNPGRRSSWRHAKRKSATRPLSMGVSPNETVVGCAWDEEGLMQDGSRALAAFGRAPGLYCTPPQPSPAFAGEGEDDAALGLLAPSPAFAGEGTNKLPPLRMQGRVGQGCGTTSKMSESVITMSANE